MFPDLSEIAMALVAAGAAAFNWCHAQGAGKHPQADLSLEDIYFDL